MPTMNRERLAPTPASNYPPMRLGLVPRTTLCAFLAFLFWGVMVSASPALSVVVSGPGIVTNVKNLRLNVTVTNTGQETLKLINDPWSPLTTSPTDSFLITGPTKISPTFIGISVKYVGVDYIAANGTSSAFTVLGPGEFVIVTHDLSKGYNFKESGPGKYTFHAASLFHYVGSGRRAVPINTITRSHQLTLRGNLSPVDRNPGVHEFAMFNNCTAVQQTNIESAITGARTYVSNAISFLSSHNTTNTRYTTWFGAFKNTRYQSVLSNFTSLTTRGNEFSAWLYDCSLVGCDPGDYAYVDTDVYGKVYLCESFWTAPATGTNSKAGILVHEGTHFQATGHTRDIAIGKRACRELANTKPGKATQNADSYEYFAENTPPLK
ncbi:hypothetical protein BDZ94DRAFT_1257728 [Collybia nuda]|uniref:Lysine-specific metallo-endopeptidase domain-containing protein n=1 Tax=Collybia nuda TaxID=64659 RepID=A0A9P5Y5G3_9AGAR|nr:hypothetical protein BDZ94DRAFT_1257728 [Collybia nuda]